MAPIEKDHPLRRYFSGLIENAFYGDVGVCDPSLTAYLSDLLVDFTHIDRLNAIRRAQGRRLDQVAAMLAACCDDMPLSSSARESVVYRRMGDYALFWAGLYPEHLSTHRRKETDVLLDYVTQGKRSYALASELTEANSAPPPSLFRHLSEEFEFCLYGLGLVRKSLEQPDPTANPNKPDLLF